MSKPLPFEFIVQQGERKIRVNRTFAAPVELVWSAWTDPEILDLWWAPKPWKTETVDQDFKPGGFWHYYMFGPSGERHYCLFDYDQIQDQISYSGLDAFCDEKKVISDDKPRMYWKNSFISQGEQTEVQIVIDFEKEEDIAAIIEMGFKEGFTMGLDNLDDYIAAQFYLRKQKKQNRQPRVSTYLNFPGNTEEAFRFYQSAFQTEFVGGIQRFSEAPPHPGQPAMTDRLKNMVLHVELPTIGGHILMGTDAPQEMGFTVESGNQVHINLEPESKAETERLFNALAQGGKITMPLQDMFWGAYFGSFTDQFGINWMLHFQNQFEE